MIKGREKKGKERKKKQKVGEMGGYQTANQAQIPQKRKIKISQSWNSRIAVLVVVMLLL
jgi:hypothetical protein